VILIASHPLLSGAVFSKMTYGLESLGVQIPRYVLALADLAEAYGVDRDKFHVGLGCHQMALCLDTETVVDLAIGAAKRAMSHWSGDLEQIGLLAVGTETSLDEARPLSAFVAEGLSLSGKIRSYEVKHACYGGTLALRQAIEWLASGAAREGQVALVIAADICLYPWRHPAECTQGAGAVAMIVGQPSLAGFSLETFPYSAPSWDFWRPTGAAYPQIHAKQSVDAYCRALCQCVEGFVETHGLERFLSLDRFCFHVPFPKMVVKAARALCQKLGLKEQDLQGVLAKITPGFSWNRQIGNAYTASLWISFAQVLGEMEAGQTVGLFSYGSGFGSEFMTATVTHEGTVPWVAQVCQDLETRESIPYERYRVFRELRNGL
jgi:hydroxymethylglutaryl-CoA synthase